MQISLNSPKTRNALSLEMMAALSIALCGAVGGPAPGARGAVLLVPGPRLFKRLQPHAYWYGLPWSLRRAAVPLIPGSLAGGPFW